MPDKDVEIVKNARHDLPSFERRNEFDAALARIEARLAALDAVVVAGDWLANEASLAGGYIRAAGDSDLPLHTALVKFRAALAQARAAGKPAAGEAEG